MIRLKDLLKETRITPNDITRILKRTGEEQDLTTPTWDEFTPEICNDGFCDVFAEKFREEYPGAELWSTEWSLGYAFGHVWVKYNNKFYDAETPNGGFIIFTEGKPMSDSPLVTGSGVLSIIWCVVLCLDFSFICNSLFAVLTRSVGSTSDHLTAVVGEADSSAFMFVTDL